jgi:hypothetical protein
MRDRLRHRAVPSAGERPVEIDSVDRRGARPSEKGRIVDGWHDDPAGESRQVKSANELGERYRPFIFIAVNAPGQEHRRTRAVLGDSDRDGDVAVSRSMHGMGHAQRAGLESLLVKVETRPNHRLVVGHCMLSSRDASD